MKVVEVGNETEFRYLVYAKKEYSGRKLVPSIWLDGTALRGNGSDKAIVARLIVDESSMESCDIAYHYGWGVLLEGEPLVIRRSEKQRK
jgi:hypothetical protein